MDPALELHFETGESCYLDLALRVLEQAERNPRLALLTRALEGADASDIATGKAYQLLWNLVALAKFHRATGELKYLQAVKNVWGNIREHHLTLGGGPWGGVGHRSREVFNPAVVFSPYGYVETCSTMAWIQLNRQLLSILGDAVYAEEIERSAYNDLLGAQAPNGEDWCYYSYPNGRRVYTTYWRCCKSSGAMALEELPALAYGVSSDGGLKVNVFGPSEAVLQLPGAGAVRVQQTTEYPFEGEVAIRIEPERSTVWCLHVRIPEWADGASIRVNDAEVVSTPNTGSWYSIERTWRAGDVLALSLPMRTRIHRRANRNVQESVAPDGLAVSQEVLHFDYLAISRGPLAYATDLIDGYKIEETLRVPAEPAEGWLQPMPAAGAEPGVDIRMQPIGRAPLTFQPYYRAGGRGDRTWRLTWMNLAPE
jgi:DUF1680 family protein